MSFMMRDLVEEHLRIVLAIAGNKEPRGFVIDKAKLIWLTDLENLGLIGPATEHAFGTKFQKRALTEKGQLLADHLVAVARQF